jgi:hypothetical protein
MASDRMTRRNALAAAAQVAVQQVADARGFAQLLRIAGSTKLADLIEHRLAEVKARDIGGHHARPDPDFWRRAGK